MVYATVQELEAHENDENAHKELFLKKVDETDFTAENIGAMLEAAGWQSGGDMSEELQSKADKDLSDVEQSDFNNKFMVKDNIFIGNNNSTQNFIYISGGHYEEDCQKNYHGFGNEFDSRFLRRLFRCSAGKR